MKYEAIFYQLEVYEVRPCLQAGRVTLVLGLP